MAIFHDGKKFACKKCLKGHRSGTCQHAEGPLFEIKKPGRPVSQCKDCRALRKKHKLHIKCVCLRKGKENEPATTDNDNENQGVTEDKVKEPEPLPLPRPQTAKGKRLREDEDAKTDADQPVRKSPCRSHNIEPVLGKHRRDIDENKEEYPSPKRLHASELPDPVKPVLGKHGRDNNEDSDNDDEGKSPKRQHGLETPDPVEPILGEHKCNTESDEGQSEQPDINESRKHEPKVSLGVVALDFTIFDDVTGADNEFPVLLDYDLQTRPPVLPNENTTYMTEVGHDLATGTDAQYDFYNTCRDDELIVHIPTRLGLLDYPDVWTGHDLRNILQNDDPFWGIDFLGDAIQTDAQYDLDSPSAQLYIP